MSTNFSGEPPDLSEWISQAEAARLHGVSRQAISKVVRSGRLRSLIVGGRVFVNRADVLAFKPQPPGRPKRGTTEDARRDRAILGEMSEEARRDLFARLREEFPIHPLEETLRVEAEVILEAIARSSPLTLRMIRGVIAEAAFGVHVVSRLVGWESREVPGNPPYDFLLAKGGEEVRVQVKLQRSKGGRPMRADEANRRFLPEMYVVETQRTRAGTDKKTNESTRPYRFGEFDILAVAMFPSTGSWDRFLYTTNAWLIPDDRDPTWLSKFQPVPPEANDDWASDFEQCCSWLRSGTKKTIRGKVSRI